MKELSWECTVILFNSYIAKVVTGVGDNIYNIFQNWLGKWYIIMNYNNSILNLLEKSLFYVLVLYQQEEQEM
jgi:hypothetical protein